MLHRALLSTAVVLAAACSSSTVRTTRLLPPPSVLGRRELIQVDELRRHRDASSMLDLLARIRPQMLKQRYGSTGERLPADGIDIFINGHFVGGPEILRQVLPADVESVRMVQRSQGYTIYGGQLRGSHALFLTLLR